MPRLLFQSLTRRQLLTAAALVPGLLASAALIRCRPDDGPYRVARLDLTDGAEGPDAAAVQLWYPLADEAPLPLPKTPLLLCFPGWLGRRPDNLLLARVMAGNGFSTAAVYYPAAELPQAIDFSTEEAQQAMLRRADRVVRQRAADASTILDTLATASAEPAWALSGALDLGRVGVFGYSLGGAVAAQACHQDPRISAAANLDGWHFADAAVDGVARDYMLLSDDEPLAEEAAAADPAQRRQAAFSFREFDRALENLDRNGGYLVRIAGTRHGNFRDTALGRLSWHWQDPALGPLDPERALEIIQVYLLAFFRQALMHEDQPLLKAPSTLYPEAQLRRWHKAGITPVSGSSPGAA
jgi:predicted dienelactone hydrolase